MRLGIGLAVVLNGWRLHGGRCFDTDEVLIEALVLRCLWPHEGSWLDRWSLSIVATFEKEGFVSRWDCSRHHCVSLLPGPNSLLSGHWIGSLYIQRTNGGLFVYYWIGIISAIKLKLSVAVHRGCLRTSDDHLRLWWACLFERDRRNSVLVLRAFSLLILIFGGNHACEGATSSLDKLLWSVLGLAL